MTAEVLCTVRPILEHRERGEEGLALSYKTIIPPVFTQNRKGPFQRFNAHLGKTSDLHVIDTQLLHYPKVTLTGVLPSSPAL